MIRHDFAGRVALVTGGTSGIGLATARAFRRPRRASRLRRLQAPYDPQDARWASPGNARRVEQFCSGGRGH